MSRRLVVIAVVLCVAAACIPRDTTQIVLDEERISEAELEPKLTALFQQDSERRVLLKADSGMSYGDLRKKFQMVQGIGFKGVSLKVVERKPAGAS